MNIDLSRPYGLHTFDIGDDGREIRFTAHRGDIHEVQQGEYCYAEDAIEYIQLLLAMREGHKDGAQECYQDDSGDFRCNLCREIDRRCGNDKSIGKLDEMLHSLRSANNGF